jgi:beta-glucosidase
MDYVGTRAQLYGSAGLVLEPAADGALHLAWNGKSRAWFDVGADAPSDIAREANGAMMLSMTVKVNAAPQGEVRLGVGSASVPVTDELKALPVGSYGTIAVPLSCFAPAQDLGKTPTVAHLETASALDIDISDVRLTETRAGAACPAS